MKKLHSLKDKICIVTGANSGLGKATTQHLAELDAKVIMVVRNREKGEKAIKEIRKKTQKGILELMICDFSSQKSIREFATNFKEKYNQLDILINNHGAVFSKKELTEDGIERTFATNYLGYFLLTNLLLDLLLESAPAKILNVSSGAYAATKEWVLADYNYDNRLYFSFKAYSESKLYDIMFTYYLADKLKEEEVTVNSYSPGFTKTNFGSGSFIMKLSMVLLSPFAKKPIKATKTAIKLVASPEFDQKSGLFLEDGKVKKTTEITYNKEYQKELWQLSKKLTNLKR